MKLKSKYKIILTIFENFGEAFISIKSPYLIKATTNKVTKA